MKRIISSVILHNTITAPALSDAILIEDYRHAVVDIILTGATGTTKVKVSNSKEKPDFSAASTPTNHWTYIDLVGRNDGGTTITGTTGVVALVPTTSNNSYAVNADAVRWIAVHQEALTTGNVSVLISGATND